MIKISSKSCPIWIGRRFQLCRFSWMYLMKPDCQLVHLNLLWKVHFKFFSCFIQQISYFQVLRTHVFTSSASDTGGCFSVPSGGVDRIIVITIPVLILTLWRKTRQKLRNFYFLRTYRCAVMTGGASCIVFWREYLSSLLYSVFFLFGKRYKIFHISNIIS